VQDIILVLENLLNINILLFILTGVTVGVMVGALPGLTATMAIALLLPFTFSMSSIQSLAFLGAIFSGAIYGGCFSAILINTPGTPAAIATTFDGYPMAVKGKAEEAITVATIGSVVGGIIGVMFLLFLTPLLAKISLKFGPPEYFWMAIFGLTIIGSISSKSILKGLLGGLFGLLISTIGISPIAGDIRFIFGQNILCSGLELIPVLLGFFCIPEVLSMAEQREKTYSLTTLFKKQKNSLFPVVKKLFMMPGLIIRSSLIGVIVGIIPAAGGNIAGMVSYNEAKRASKYPEKFGTGVMEGVAASETANNAEVAGSLIPLLSLGIPGSAPAAVLLGALLMQGLRPGLDLFTTQSAITYTFIFSLFISNIMMLPVGLYGGKLISKIVSITPIYLLAPLVTFLSIIGSYALRNNMLDVYIMLLCGFIGYLGIKMGFHAGPIVLGLILGPICEQGLVQSILIGQATIRTGPAWIILFTRPISIVLIILSVISVSWPFLAKYAKYFLKRRANKGEIKQK